MKSTKKVITDWENVPLYMDLPYVSMLFGFSVECLKKKAQKGIFPAKKCTVNGVSQKKTQKNIMIHYKEA